MAASERVGVSGSESAAPRETEPWSNHLRPRSPFEAIDFGLQFARSHYADLIQLCTILIVPLGLLALPFVLAGHVWASLVLWWLKPLWERPLLHYLSRALFGQGPGVRETLRAFPSYGRRGLLAGLTLQRLSPTRSFDLPVVLLEGASGRVRRERLQVLRRGQQGSAAAALTVVLAHVEVFLQFGLLALVGFFLPDTSESLLEALLGEGAESEVAIWTGVVTHLIFVASMALVAPFYVAAGFSLYVHRRSELEAWDLELVFRRIATRVRRRPGASALVGLGLAALLTTLAPPAARAGVALSREEARSTIEEILAGDDFHEIETWTLPKLVFDWDVEDTDESPGSLPDWLADLLGATAWILASMGQITLVAIALIVLVWIGFRVAGLEPLSIESGARRARRHVPPRELFGLEIAQESLPDDVAASAQAAAMAGRAREALALLYRGALSQLAFDRGLKLVRGMTEGECLERATPLLAPDPLDYFARLTRAWLHCAYGHHEPEPEELLALCGDWSAAFRVQSVEGAE